MNHDTFHGNAEPMTYTALDLVKKYLDNAVEITGGNPENQTAFKLGYLEGMMQQLLVRFPEVNEHMVDAIDWQNQRIEASKDFPAMI